MSRARKPRLALLLVLFTVALASPAAALGVSPSTVSFSRVLPGGYAERPLMISSGTATEPEHVDVSVTGPLSSWIRIASDAGLTLEATKPVRLTVIVEPPPDAEANTYRGTLKVRTTPIGAEETPSGMGVSVGIDVPLSVEVVETSIARYDVLEVRPHPLTPGEPLAFDALIVNSGNVPVSPAAEATVTGTGTAGQGSFMLSGSAIEPSREAWQTFRLEDVLVREGADYTATVRFILGQKTVAEEVMTFARRVASTLHSTVIEGTIPTTSSRSGPSGVDEAQGDPSSSLLVPVAILLVVVAAFLAAATLYLARSRMPPRIKKPPSKPRSGSRLGGAGGH